jgi:transposase InsO family protein
MILDLVQEATDAGAGFDAACEVLDLSGRTVQRWRLLGGGEDRRYGPKREPSNKLSAAEKRAIIEVANSPEYRDVSPKQIVPRLADQGIFIASESSFYRTLHEHDLVHHRERSNPASAHRPSEHVATGPWQVASWDITYLKTCVAGSFFYLYLVVDVWSRKILGWEVHEQESKELAAELIDTIAADADVDLAGWVLHADNGGPMRGSTMVATLQRLGVIPSFSRPHVSDDNPFSEALFRTMKYRPAYPTGGFTSLDQARAWVDRFVRWYNTEHLHSGIRYVTPADRHSGRDVEILANRRRVYERARRRNPNRWSRDTRNWNRIEVVYLNPEPKEENAQEKIAA